MNHQSSPSLLSFEEDLLTHITIRGLQEHLALERTQITFTEQEPEGDSLHMPGCTYNPILDKIYIRRDPDYTAWQLIGLIAHCLYEVHGIKNRWNKPVRLAEADVFGDFYQTLIARGSELLTLSSSAEHFSILFFHGDRYLEAISVWMNRFMVDPTGDILVILEDHYARNAWKLYDDQKIKPIRDSLVSFIERPLGLFAPEVYITLLVSPVDERIRLETITRSYAQHNGLQDKFEFLLALFDRCRDQQPSEEEANLVTCFTDLPDGVQNLYCGSFIADDDGIRQKGEKTDKETLVSKTPVTIFKTFRNFETDRKLITLAYRDIGWNTITCGAEILTNDRQLKKDLGSRGVFIKSGNLLSEYLVTLMERNKSDRLRPDLYVEKLGWQGTDFVPYSNVYHCRTDDPLKEKKRNAITCSGDRQEWTRSINALRADGYTLVKIALAASFGSVLKGFSHTMDSTYIVSFYGSPLSGKSVILRLAASIWGDPYHLVGNFNESKPAIYETAAFMNDLPFLLDDSSNTIIPAGEEFSQLIYSLFEGRGKVKMSGASKLAAETRWNSCAIITGEKSALSLVRADRGGAKTRILDLPTPEKVFKDPSLYEKISMLSRNHYGFAGKDFVNAVQKIGQDRINDLFRQYCELLKQLSCTSGHDTRTLYPIASLLLADRIASIYIYEEEKHTLSVQEFVQAMQNQPDGPDATEQCYAYITHNQADLITQGKALTDDHYPDYLLFRKEQLNALVSDYSMTTEVFLPWLRDKGLLLTDKNKNTKNKRLNGNLVKLYYVKTTGYSVSTTDPTEEDLRLEETTVARISETIRRILFAKDATKTRQDIDGQQPLSLDPAEEDSAHSPDPYEDAVTLVNDGPYFELAYNLSWFASCQYDHLLRSLTETVKNDQLSDRIRGSLLCLMGDLNENYIKRPNIVRALDCYQKGAELLKEDRETADNICRAFRSFEDTFRDAKSDWFRYPLNTTDWNAMNDYKKEHFVTGIVLGIYSLFRFSDNDDEEKKDRRSTWSSIIKEIQKGIRYASNLLTQEEQQTVLDQVKHLVRFYHPELVEMRDKEELEDFADEYTEDAEFRQICNEQWAEIIEQYEHFIPREMEPLIVNHTKDCISTDMQAARVFMLKMLRSGFKGQLPEAFVLLAAKYGDSEIRLELEFSDSYLPEEALRDLLTDPDPSVRGQLILKKEITSYPDIIQALRNDEDEEFREVIEEYIKLRGLKIE